MIKYCLAYDAKDSKEAYESTNIKNTEVHKTLKLKVAKTLIDAKALNLESPVASVINFYDNSDEVRLNYWANKLSALENEIYYYLCCIAMRSNGTYFEVNKKDIGLNNRFQYELKSK